MAKRRRLDFSGVAEPVQIGGTAREILQKTVDDGVADLDMAKAIRLELIEPDPDQPRKHFDEEALQELAQSIRVQGVLQPIVVEWIAEAERFRIISGERRWRATRLAAELQEQEEEGTGAPRRDLSRIPAVIRNPNAIDRYLQQVYENEQRRDYSDVERAFAYERLKESLGLTWEELAAKLGLSKGRIHQIRRTKNRLAPAVQIDISTGALTGRHGLYLAPLPGEVQEAVAQAVKDHHLTHQQTKTVVDRVRTALAVELPVEAVPAVSTDPAKSAAAATAGEKPRSGSQDNNLTEHETVPPAPGEGPTTRVAAVVEETVAAVTAAKPEIPRSRHQDLDKGLALVRQLLRRDWQVPEAAADRAKLAGALDELIAWAQGLKARLEG
ncbi:MAG: ParB/RepB/Spo0J family partition protein [Chloroflexota bacterium]